MKTNILFACAALIAGGPIAAAPITIDTPWLRETFPGAKAGAGYAILRNGGAQEDRLLGGSTAAADAVEVHSMTMDGGIMRMRAVPDGLPIPARGRAALQSGGGYHLMLTGLKHPLRKGETVEIKLRFARAGTIATRFRVEAIDYQPGR